MTTPSSPNKTRTLKILIIRSSSIGDTVLATACIDFLKKLAVPYELTWLTRAPAMTLLSKSFQEVKFFDIGKLDPSAWEVILGMEICIDLQKNPRSIQFCRQFTTRTQGVVHKIDKLQLQRILLLLKARLRPRQTKSPSLLPKAQYLNMVHTLAQALPHHLHAKAAAILNDTPPHPQLIILKDKQDPSPEGLLAIAPGANYATKRAPTQVFAKILNQLASALHNANIPLPALISLGDANDYPLGEEIFQQLTHSWKFSNAAGKLSLYESGQKLAQAQVVLANDSALAHISEAVGTPTHTLFGPTSESFGFYPWHPNSKAFSLNLGCRPCSKHGKSICRYKDNLCFLGLDTQEVSKSLFDIVLKTINLNHSNQNILKSTEIPTAPN